MNTHTMYTAQPYNQPPITDTVNSWIFGGTKEHQYQKKCEFIVTFYLNPGFSHPISSSIQIRGIFAYLE